MVTGIVRQVAAGRGFRRLPNSNYVPYYHDNFDGMGGVTLVTHLPELRPNDSGYAGDNTEFVLTGTGELQGNTVNTGAFLGVYPDRPTIDADVSLDVSQVEGSGLIVSSPTVAQWICVCIDIIAPDAHPRLLIIVDPEGVDAKTVITSAHVPDDTEVHTLHLMVRGTTVYAAVNDVMISAVLSLIDTYSTGYGIFCNNPGGSIRFDNFSVAVAP